MMYVVHWPGQSVFACESHKDGLNALATAMGLPGLTIDQAPNDSVCSNCENEQTITQTEGVFNDGNMGD